MIIPILAKQILPPGLLHKDFSISYPQDTKTDRRYEMFVVTWSIAALFHMAQSRSFAEGLHFAFLTIAAAFLIAKPASVLRLIIFLAVQISASLRVMPYVSNHELFVMLVDLSILHAILYYVFRAKSFSIDKNVLFGIFAPLIKIELIILYFYVVFHKLNSGFFNTDVSCATVFYQAQTYSFLPSSKFILSFNAYLTIFIEALIPVLLCFRKSRNLGLLIGLVFHCIIAFNPINGFYDFSSAIFATYVVFASRNFSSTAFELFKQAGDWLGNHLRPTFSAKRLGLAVAGLLALMFFIYILSKEIQDYFRYVFWPAFSLVFIFILLKSYQAGKTSEESRGNKFRVAHFSLLLFPLLVFLNGLCPYLGLKTESSFAMFSNLRTEGGISNHFIVPAEVQIFDFQKDLVEVRSSSHPIFQKMANNGQVIPYFQFKELVITHRPEKVKFIHQGQKHNFVLANASSDDALMQPNPFILKKVLRFRPVRKDGPQYCKH